MPLTNCSQCRYIDTQPNHNDDIICAVQPAYAVVWQRLKDLASSTINCIPLDFCRDFELHPDLQEKELTISLTLKEWQQLASHHSNLKLLEQLRQQEIETNSLDRWIEIDDSSCIAGFAFDPFNSVLLIWFERGAIYRYERVPVSVFENFRDSDSKGTFFNNYIKNCALYTYRRL